MRELVLSESRVPTKDDDLCIAEHTMHRKLDGRMVSA